MSAEVIQWAIRWGVSFEAVADLARIIGTDSEPNVTNAIGMSEAYTQSKVRLEAPMKGVKLFRNNVGVLEDINGRPVRYGLANDTKGLNGRFKSGDLIGWRKVLIGPHHVGGFLAQFVSRECKPPGWQFRGDAHELAQQRWAQMVTLAGGDAKFATGEGTL